MDALGALAGDQVELRELLALFSRSDQDRAAVELIDDLEDRLLPFLGGRLRREQPADPQMRFRAPVLRDQRVGGFLHTVVDEPVGAFRTLDELLADRLPQSRVNSAPPMSRERSRAS